MGILPLDLLFISVNQTAFPQQPTRIVSLIAHNLPGMLDVNLYTLNFVRSTNEPDKLFLIQESTGEPVYFRLRVPAGGEIRTELYHASTLAPLGVFQPLSSKLKLISLANPSATIELKNSGYINFEWTFYFDKVLKFCWRKDIIGMAGSKRGYTCWMSRKPDPDYPCAIYRPGTSTLPPSCQFLDFNIRRIENLQDPRGLEFTIILALLGFTEAVADPEPRQSPSTSPPLSHRQIPAAQSITNHYPIEANELRVAENSSTSDLVTQGHKLFEDPLFLYLSVHAPSPKTFKRAVAIAEQIKRDRFKRHGEELYQYLVDDIMTQEMSTGRLSASSSSNTSKPSSLKVYLSRTPLDELLPKSATSSKTNKKAGKSTAYLHKPQVPPKEPKPSSSASSSPATLPHNSLHSRFMTGVQRPFSKIASIASFSTRSSAYYQHYITPYYLEEESEEEDSQDQDEPKEQYQHSDEERTQAEEPGPITETELHEASVTKPEQYLICVNELNAIGDEAKKNQLVSEKTSTRASTVSPSTASSQMSFRLSSCAGSPDYSSRRSSLPSSISDEANIPGPSTGSHASGCSTTGRISPSYPQRAESVRSQASSIRSCASSFVEIITSSCCNAFANPLIADTTYESSPPSNTCPSSFKRLAHKTFPLKHSCTPSPLINSAWKRISSHSSFIPSSSSKPPNPSDRKSYRNSTSGTVANNAATTNSSHLVSTMFSRTLQLS